MRICLIRAKQQFPNYSLPLLGPRAIIMILNIKYCKKIAVFLLVIQQCKNELGKRSCSPLILTKLPAEISFLSVDLAINIQIRF